VLNGVPVLAQGDHREDFNTSTALNEKVHVQYVSPLEFQKRLTQSCQDIVSNQKSPYKLKHFAANSSDIKCTHY